MRRPINYALWFRWHQRTNFHFRLNLLMKTERCVTWSIFDRFRMDDEWPGWKNPTLSHVIRWWEPTKSSIKASLISLSNGKISIDTCQNRSTWRRSKRHIFRHPHPHLDSAVTRWCWWSIVSDAISFVIDARQRTEPFAGKRKEFFSEPFEQFAHLVSFIGLKWHSIK